MVQVESYEHEFPVPWEHATTAFWCKYPSPELANVKDALVLERRVVDGVLFTTRLIAIEDSSLPPLLRRFSSGDAYYALEKSRVDPANREMVLETQNLTFSAIIRADERCVYRAPRAENAPDRDDGSCASDNASASSRVAAATSPGTSTSASAGRGQLTCYSWEMRCTVRRHIPFLSDKIELALAEKAKSNSTAGLAKMDVIAVKVSDKWKQDSAPRFLRWPTAAPARKRASSRRKWAAPDGEGTETDSDAPRRFMNLFGPRKPISASSWCWWVASPQEDD